MTCFVVGLAVVTCFVVGLAVVTCFVVGLAVVGGFVVFGTVKNIVDADQNKMLNIQTFKLF